MRIRVVAVMGALAASLGCDSGGSSSGTYASWKANGAPEAAEPYYWDWNSDGVQDSFGMVASSGNTFLQISLAGPTPLLAGTYQCGQTTPQAALAYAGRDVQSTTAAQTCSITLTEVGSSPNRPIAGTFEATVMDAAGATATLTDGRFALARTR